MIGASSLSQNNTANQEAEFGGYMEQYISATSNTIIICYDADLLVVLEKGT
jgi:hypothetical protein